MLYKGMEGRKISKAVAFGVRGRKGRVKTCGGPKVTPFQAPRLPAGTPLGRERVPIASYYGSEQWNDVPGN